MKAAEFPNELTQAAFREEGLVKENNRLREALRDAHGLIDNELVIPWIIRHKLDDVLIGQ